MDLYNIWKFLTLIKPQKNACEITLFEAFWETDASLAEINPLVVTADNRVIALDAKFNFDDNALFRHPEIVAMRDTEAAVEKQSLVYKRRRDALCQGLARIGWDVTPPQATMFCWVPIPEPWRSSMSTMDFGMLLLEKGNVAVSPGSGFGPAGEGFLRMSLVENEQRLQQAVRQIDRCLRDAKATGHGDPVAKATVS